jgi:Cu(I)/Ag(I) efflux system membrane fusion protein
MKNTKYLILFLTYSFLIFSCRKDSESENHEVHEVVYYTCSMDPQIKEDKPGECPICHMTLTPMKEDKSAANQISLSDQQIKLGNISIIEMSESSNSIQEKFTGVLSINQGKVNTIAARAMGRIERLYFKTVGDYISKNAPIYDLYSEDLAIAKQDYLTAFKQIEMPGIFGKNAKAVAESAKQKLLFFGLSEKQIQQIVELNELSPNTTFYSSYNGYISEILNTEGNFIMEGTSLYKLSALNSLWLEAQVNVNYANKIHVGQESKVAFTDFPKKIVFGKVSFINPEINPDTRLLLVRIEIQNKDLTLKPGMQGIIELKQSNLKGFFLPINAVIQEENASYVWLEKEKGVYENVMVTTGIETDGLIEIKTGLENGNKVAISGAYAINSEYRFRKGADPMAGHDMSAM